MLKETATSLGLIVIDGFDSSADWLRSEDLLSALVGEPQVDILWCGKDPELDDDSAYLYQSLVESEFFYRSYKPFSELAALVSTLVVPETVQRWDEPEVVSFGADKKLVITPQLRLATQASSTIFDDSWTGFLAPLRPEEESLKFEFFHGAVGGLANLVEGVRRGFALSRDFETELSTAIDRAMHRPHEMDHAIVLHGQSGVGKTIALIAYSVSARNKRSAAVLYARNRIPHAADVTPFLELVDKLDEVTLIVCDSMVEPQRYDDFLDSLRSRGHRAVVVGSTYRIEEEYQSDKSRFIEAPAELAQRELAELGRLVERYAASAEVEIRSHATQSNALARFYRELPVSRGRLAVGLGHEAQIVEAKIRSRGKKKRQIEAIGVLGEQLIKAGFESPTVEMFQSDSDLTKEAGPAATRLIDYVMAVSRLYQSVPVNLVLRAILESQGSEYYDADLSIIADLFKGIDLFRWEFADQDGEELLVSARLQLEAELICNRRLDGPKGEVSRILDLIQCSYRAGPEDNEETRFLTNVVFALGPDGPFRHRYKDSYVEIARALTTLREKHNVLNARLMLQEATLRRSYVRLHELEDTESEVILDEATRAIEDALKAVDEDSQQPLYVARRTKEYLWVERAATYGFLATHSAKSQDTSDESWSSYLAAREAVRHAIGRVDTYFPLDIGLWLPAAMLRDVKNLSTLQQAELQADIQATLDLVDVTELDSVQAERFQQQRLRLSDVLANDEIGDDAFNLLLESGSCAGIYLRAKSKMPLKPGSGEPVLQKGAANETRTFLNSYYDTIRTDARCLHLLLIADWLDTTGDWLFDELRQGLPIEESDCTRMRGILLDYIAASEDMVKPKYKYLDAVFNWLTNNEHAARSIWRNLARETEFVASGRIASRHTIRNASGKPVQFVGIVDRQVGQRRWRMQVPSLGRTVDLLSDSRSRETIEAGKTLKGFGISFNYLGPIADFFIISTSA
jgi:hypothetical protein